MRKQASQPGSTGCASKSLDAVEEVSRCSAERDRLPALASVGAISRDDVGDGLLC